MTLLTKLIIACLKFYYAAYGFWDWFQAIFLIANGRVERNWTFDPLSPI